MKKTVLAFAALTAASFACAETMPQPAEGQGMFPGLQEVQYQGVRPASKNDDRVKFVYAAENVSAAPAPAEPAPAPETPAAGLPGTPADSAPAPVDPLPQGPAANP